VSTADRILVCRECGARFTFTSGEQAFFASRGLLNQPSRCPACRNARKASGDCESSAGYVPYGRAASFGGRVPRQMHPATCTSCGQMTEVPFIAQDDRPVYCSECFSEARDDPPQSSLPPRSV